MNELFIYEPISEGFALRFQPQLAKFAGKPITVRINSPGGSVFQGLAVYELLKNHGAKVTVIIDGIAASIASIIAMAGHEIHIGSAAMVMIHDARLATRGNAAQLTKDAGTVEKISGSLAGIYAARTKKPLAKIRDLMLAETWLTASQAIALGFADKLVPGLKAAASASWTAASYPSLPAAALAAAGLSTLPSTNMQPSATLKTFLSTGSRPASEQGRNALLDELRSVITAEAPATSSAPEKPDFSHLHGLALTTAAMQWEAEQKAGASVAPTPIAPVAPKATASGVTAAEIAAEIIQQQKAEARKPTGLAKVTAAFQAQNVSKQSN